MDGLGLIGMFIVDFCLLNKYMYTYIQLKECKG